MVAILSQIFALTPPPKLPCKSINTSVILVPLLGLTSDLVCVLLSFHLEILLLCSDLPYLPLNHSHAGVLLGNTRLDGLLGLEFIQLTFVALIRVGGKRQSRA